MNRYHRSTAGALCLRCVFPLLMTALCAGQEAPPRNELAFGLGGLTRHRRSDVPMLTLGPGVALQVNYGRRIWFTDTFALYGEVHFLASPSREITANTSVATHDVASLYITPGIRLKLRPTSKISPYFAAGGGYAEYEQSRLQLDGRPNTAPRELSRAAVDFGVGSDFRVWRWIELRGELRDFYSGSPAYNVPSIRGGQHNVVAGGAIVFRWH